MVFARPSTAMVLAAGYGHRMRPLTDDRPKPLVPFAGKPLLDHVLDRLAEAGVTSAVVNVHYLPEQIEAHLAARISPAILISDERAQILDTGGAVQKALPHLGSAPFFVHNSDSVWIERNGSALRQMMQAWDEDAMDALLLLAPAATSLGYSGIGDYAIGASGRPCRRRCDQPAVPHVFAGVSINHPRIFQNCSGGAFSILRLWDEAEAAGRLAAIQLDGLWMHIGTPEALAQAEERLNGQPA